MASRQGNQASRAASAQKVKGLSASKAWANASQAVWRLAVGDLDIETGKVCDRLHGFAFVLIGSMLEPRQRESPSTVS